MEKNKKCINNRYWLGKKFSSEHRKRISESHRGHKMSDSTSYGGKIYKFKIEEDEGNN